MLDTRRHDEVFNKLSFREDVHVIGVGGVGSHVSRLLGKLGVGAACNVHLYDGDRVESHNPPNQTYYSDHVGILKVQALQDQYRRWSGGTEAIVHPEFVKEKLSLAGVVFLCLDSMDERRRICEESIFGNTQVRVLIETRTGLDTIMVYCLNPNHQRHVDCWKSYWYPSAEADRDLGCSGPLSIITAVDGTAVFAVQRFIEYATKGGVADIINRFWINLRTSETESEVW